MADAQSRLVQKAQVLDDIAPTHEIKVVALLRLQVPPETAHERQEARTKGGNRRKLFA